MANLLRLRAYPLRDGMRWEFFRFVRHCGVDHTVARKSHGVSRRHRTVPRNRHHCRRIHQRCIGRCNLVIVRRRRGEYQF